MKQRLYKTFVTLMMAIAAITFVVPVAAQSERTDSINHQPTLTPSNTEVRGRMMSSPLPVTMRQQGRQICVQSRYNQLLPVYTENGTFYTAVRLSKGTNWITGLPKGTYLINNRKFTIF